MLLKPIWLADFRLLFQTISFQLCHIHQSSTTTTHASVTVFIPAYIMYKISDFKKLWDVAAISHLTKACTSFSTSTSQWGHWLRHSTFPNNNIYRVAIQPLPIPHNKWCGLDGTRILQTSSQSSARIPPLS